jgi:hypothetical protein
MPMRALIFGRIREKSYGERSGLSRLCDWLRIVFEREWIINKESRETIIGRS